MQTLETVPWLTAAVGRELLAELSAGASQKLPSGWRNVSETADSTGQMLTPRGTAAGKSTAYILKYAPLQYSVSDLCCLYHLIQPTASRYVNVWYFIYIAYYMEEDLNKSILKKTAVK